MSVILVTTYDFLNVLPWMMMLFTRWLITQKLRLSEFPIRSKANTNEPDTNTGSYSPQ